MGQYDEHLVFLIREAKGGAQAELDGFRDAQDGVLNERYSDDRYLQRRYNSAFNLGLERLELDAVMARLALDMEQGY